MKNLILLFLALIVTSCGQTFNTDGGSLQDQRFNAITCSCTPQYNPVCAYVNNSYVTYTNACLAQCAGVDFTQGLCIHTTSQANNQNCNSNSGQVCGRPIVNCVEGTVCATVLPQAKLYDNECQMILEGAESASSSSCN